MRLSRRRDRGNSIREGWPFVGGVRMPVPAPAVARSTTAGHRSGLAL